MAHSYEAAHSKNPWGYPYVEYPIANTYEVDPAIVIRAVYGVRVKLPAHSYEAAHSKKLWGYPYVQYPIAVLVISRNGPYIRGHPVFYSTLNFKDV